MSKITEKIFKGERHYLTKAFGERETIEVNGGQTPIFHSGADYTTDGKKLAQYALEKGTVIKTGVDNAGAKYVTINYPRLNINMSHYHLDSIRVSVDNKVDNNTIIGYTGKTGWAQDIHLHLAIYDLNLNKYVDPEIYALTYKEKTNTREIKIGDVVIVNGKVYSNSYGGKVLKTLKNYKGKITIINIKGVKQYHIDNLGWVDQNDIFTRKYHHKKNNYSKKGTHNKGKNKIQ